MKILYVIPARGGSKGVPAKNIKPFMGKPLIHYAIDTARACAVSETDICLSTDDDQIAAVVKDYCLEVHFMRPAELATDTAGTYEVLLHALGEMEKMHSCTYEVLVLLQPTSPFRKPQHVREALALYDNGIDMVVSVKEAESNPYFTLFEENSEGWLEKSKKGNFTRRQDAPPVWELNGAVYIINVEALRRHASIAQFSKVRKYPMSQTASVDLDTPLDWRFAELLVEEGYISLK